MRRSDGVSGACAFVMSVLLETVTIWSRPFSAEFPHVIEDVLQSLSSDSISIAGMVAGHLRLFFWGGIVI